MQYGSILATTAFAAVVCAAPNWKPTRATRVIMPRADSLTLEDDAVQSGSFLDGSTSIGAAEAGQAKSVTSTNNFINTCSGKTLTNGLQITSGSCNGIPMGDIPAKTSMVSSVITFPKTGGDDVEADKTFQITVQMSNIVPGSFTNADATYYAAPQTLSGGLVVGHTHVTVQDMGDSLNPTTAMDPTKFAFFKGINDAGNGQLLLTANVTGGLPAGNYRVCTMASASNHQPVLMPVAQRGTADDCTKFTVSGSGSTENVAANDGSAGIVAADAAQSAVDAGVGATVAATDSSVTTSSATTSSISTTKTKAAKTTATTTTKKAKGKDDVVATRGSDSALTLIPRTITATTGSFSGTTITLTSGSASATAMSSATATASGTNVQTFTGTLGGSAPAVIQGSGDRPFSTDGVTFVTSAAAILRSCSVQHNACSNAANAGTLSGGQAQCETQETACTALITKRYAHERAARVARRKYIL